VKFEQCLEILPALLSNPRQQRSALFSGFYDRLFVLFDAEVSRILSFERNFVFDLQVGSTALLIARLLRTFFTNPIITRFLLARKTVSVANLMRTFFQLRALVIQQSKHLEDSLVILRECIGAITAETFEIDTDVVVRNANGRELFITIALDSVRFEPVEVVHELAGILLPEAAVANVPIVLQKLSSQDEYIPGRVSNQPIDSRTIGTLMVHIKNRICTELRMDSLINDDHGMELLVANNIIDLSLQIQDVYRHIWVPAHNETPMVVVFRLQGLSGEATEPLIRSFPSANRDSRPPEERFDFTKVLAVGDSFKPLLNALASDPNITFVADAIKCLTVFTAVRANREAIARHGGIRIGFDMLRAIVDQGVTPPLFESVDQFLASLVREHSETDLTPEADIDLIFELMGLHFVRANDALLPGLLALLPPLASRSQALMAKVLQRFIDGLTPIDPPPGFNIFETPTSSRLLNGFGEFALALPPNESGNAIRDLIIKKSFVRDALSFLVSLFPIVDEKPTFPKTSLAFISLPALLKTVTGMVIGYSHTQQLLLDAGILPTLLDLERQISENSIGELATDLLDHALVSPSVCASAITALRDQRRTAERALAAKEREQALSPQALSPELLLSLAEIEDDDGWQCLICKDGYQFYPKDPLGFYVWTPDAGTSTVSTTHFNCVHMRCHASATRGKSEWDAAAVVNCEHRCNGIFPIPAESLKPGEYTQQVAHFFSSGWRSAGPEWACVLEVKNALRIVADRAVPAGATVANAVAFVPFLVFAGHALMSASSGKASVRADYGRRMAGIIAGAEACEQAFALSLWTLSLEEWRWARLPLLGAALRRLKIDANINDDTLFERVRPILVEYWLTDGIQKLLKCEIGIPARLQGGALVVDARDDAPWIAQFTGGFASPAGYRIWTDSWKPFADDIERLSATVTPSVIFDSTRDIPSPLEWVRSQCTS
jgi:E3 ubiquitin-protein ligase UBR4